MKLSNVSSNSLEKKVGQLIRENKSFQKAMDEEPELKHVLTGIVEKNYQDSKNLVKWSEWVDKSNLFLGPAEVGLRAISNLGTPGFAVYSIGTILHYGIVKLPYIAYYATQDWKGAGVLALLEVAKYMAPFGAAADVLPAYTATLERKLDSQVVQQFETYLAKQGMKAEEREKYVMRDGIKVQKELAVGYNTHISDGNIYLDLPSQAYTAELREVGHGIHEVVLSRLHGLHPAVMTTHKLKLPKNVEVLRLVSGLSKIIAEAA